MRFAIPVALLITATVSTLRAENVEHLKFFEHKVRPLLSEECFECHGPEKSKGGLRLDPIDLIQKGGDSGPALVPGKPKESLIIEAVHRLDENFAMPPKKELPKEAVEVLEQWISLGAPWPKNGGAATGAVDENGFTEEDHKWWAIQPVQDPKVPQSGDKWVRNPIDEFILRKLKEKDLKPAPRATREELVRRAYFDLHGLPPTPEQVRTFVEDDRPNAWEMLIDELLASPRYGERWAQHWLDVVRYAESDGYRADGFRSGTWKYRDYVIRSLNEDKPYDQFVREQLAADEFDADDPDSLIATAFLRLGIYEYNQRNARMHWDLIMTEMTNVTGEAFLGLGIGCAQCHDHKFDPILQKDHFALQAFLNSTWWPEHAPLATTEEKAEYDKQMADWEKATESIRKELDGMTKVRLESSRKSSVKQFPQDVQDMYYKPAEERTAYEEQLAQLVQRQVEDTWDKIKWETEFEKKKNGTLEKYKKLNEKLAKFDKLKPKPLPEGFISTDVGREPAKTFLEKRGNKDEVEPAFLTILGQPAPKIQPTKSTTGRRLALADWIASENNPLSTRVVTNRIWQRHFGRGIVPTPNDFGTLGEEPSHPELLDWLTRRFLEQGWKWKPIHRLIMTSAAYQQTARREPTSKESVTDPENSLLWKFHPQRLQAEQVRDAMLAASGELKHLDKGGSSVDGDSPNRSIFVKKRRNTPDEMLGGFDSPNGFSSMPNRTPTTTPNQSLMLVNGEWTLDRAKAFASRILGEKKEVDAEIVGNAFRIAYGREPIQSEIDGALAFILSQENVVPGSDSGPQEKYPGETGLRPISQKFGKVDQKLALGDNALWLQPGSRFEKLDFSSIKLPPEEFTIEAVCDLDGVHADASVNTLAARWNGSQQTRGWTFGVTSAKSRYEPRNFIMQLTGDDFQGTTIYEVVASDLRFPMNKPVYIAAVVSAKPQKDDVTKGFVTFYMKELDDPYAPLQKTVVEHQITGGLETKDVRSILGARDQKGHWWDGQLARFVISDGALREEQLLVNGGTARRILDFDFSSKNGEEPEPDTAWIREAASPSSPRTNTKLHGALTDLCQALLTSNEFLYLH